MSLLVALALACSSTQSIPVGGGTAAGGDSGASAANDTAEHLPTPDPTVEPALTSPGLVELTCPGPIPVDTDIPCDIRILHPDGSEEWSGPAALHQRGRSSAGFPKPQYRLTLRDDDRAAAEADLFGMGGEADWVLNGMWIDRDQARLAFEDDDGTGSRFIVKADEQGFASGLQYAAWAIDSPSGSELTREVEAGVDGWLRMVPWDLDLTLGQPDYNENWRTDTWIAYRPALVSLPAEQSAFRARLVERWEEARQGPLATAAVLERIAGQRAVLGDAVDRNWARWDITTVDFGGQLYVVGSPEEEYARVEAWVVARLEWMDEEIGDY